MRVILDTNVWIDFFVGKLEVLNLKSILTEMKILRHIWIESKFQNGNIPKSEIFFSYYNQIPETTFVDYKILFQFISKEKLVVKSLYGSKKNLFKAE